MLTNWTSTVGPRIAKALDKKLSALRRLAFTEREIYEGVPMLMITMSIGADCPAKNPKALELLSGLHAKYQGAITKESRAAMEADLDRAIEVATASIPTVKPAGC